MALNATNFVVKGPIKSADMMQFVNLFTGVMTDQPVTFKNALTVGSSQGTGTAPLSLYGATGQTSNLLNLYPNSASANPTWGIAALGQLSWGAGSPVVLDTYLSRIALQNGHATDTAGLLIQPYLEVAGNISATTYLFPNSATITGPVGNPFYVVVNQFLALNNVNNYLTYVSATAPNMSLSIRSANGFVSANGTGGTSQGNTYYNGSGWIPWNTSNVSVLFNVASNGVAMYQAAAGVNPITTWGAATFSVTPAGALLAAQSVAVGGSQNILRPTANNPNILSLEAQAGYLYVSSGGATTGTSANAYHDGSAWQRYNTANAASLMILNNSAPLLLYYTAAGANPVNWGNAIFSVSTSGAVSIPVNAPYYCSTARWYSDGNVSFYQVANATGSHWFQFQNGSGWAPVNGGAYTNSSSAKDKADMLPLADPLSLVLDPALHGISYVDIPSGEHRVGFVADAWLPKVPEIVQFYPDSDEILGMNYDRVGAITFEALKHYVQQTDARLAALERRLAA